MKFTCEKNAILNEILVAQDIITTKNNLSILSNVLLDAVDNQLTVKATDLKVSFETTVPVEVVEPGRNTVFCDKFLNIIRSLPDGDVEFEHVNKMLMIKPLFKKINFQLKTIDAEKFPELTAVTKDRYFEIPQKDFIEMISQTIFSISDDETRFFMNGVYLEYIENGKLIMVATDGRRLSYISKEVDSEIEPFKGIIIPPKILNLIRKMASGEGNIAIAVTDKNIFVQFDNLRLASNLMEGQFPNYHKVIPEKQENALVMRKDDLLEALKRVSLLAENKSRRIYLKLERNNLKLHSEEADLGTAIEEIECQYDGADTSIALNYLYLYDPLKIMDTEEISIQFTETNKAITLVSKPHNDYFHIIMPMQLD